MSWDQQLKWYVWIHGLQIIQRSRIASYHRGSTDINHSGIYKFWAQYIKMEIIILLKDLIG